MGLIRYKVDLHVSVCLEWPL